MYDPSWHAHHAAKTKRSAELTLSTLRAVLPFESALDVGCGSGLWLDVAKRLGCREVQGIDGPWTDMKTLQLAPEDFRIADLAQPFRLGRRYDVAISLEVAEHVDPDASDIFVDNLVGHADLVVFGAAIPFQGGYRHINERWQSAWSAKFATRGFTCRDVLRPILWDSPDVHYWYKQNLLVYVKASRPDLVERVEAFMKERGIVGFPIDIVHPEKFDAIASYTEIAFKPLARQLPLRLGQKLRAIATMRL